MLKEHLQKLIDISMSIEDYKKQEDLMECVRDILDTLQDTINAPSNWRDIKERLQEEYKNDNDVLYYIEF